MNELLTPSEMARADAAAIAAGISGDLLMNRAGWAVARAARQLGPCRTLVLCGPGGNGGDGYVAARLLAGWGWPVRVAALAPPRPGSDAANAAAAWDGPMAAFDPAEAARAGLVIDAVFGAGLARDVDGNVAETLAAARRILAIDVPSGVDGATGAVRGRVAQAEVTVTFFRRKPGHGLLPGRDLCGRLVLADIGIPASVLEAIRPQTWSNGPGLWSLPVLPATTQKYARGYVTVLGGASMTGAAQLSAAAARHGGAGMVTIAAEDAAARYFHVPAGLIVSDTSLESLLEDARRTTWVCGPGLGQDAARRDLPKLIAAGRRVVLLKGSDTVVAAPDGRAAINGTGTPALATAGSGDVLSGLIAALLAAGMPAWEAACAGAWVHGRAGQALGIGLVAEDLPAAIGRVVAEQS
jgi:hydroxyethylthiazole kinase-like uncharacterized protein yjeF